MKITIRDLLSHSYVLTSRDRRLAWFYDVFSRNGLLPLPKPYRGRIVDRHSDEYKKNRHLIAAHYSHFEICEMAARDDWPFVCIFEEDAYPCKDVLMRLAKMLANIPDDADIVKLGYVPYDGSIDDGRDEIGWVSVLKDRYVSNYMGGSHAYIIFKSFFKQSAAMKKIFEEKILVEKDVRPLHHPSMFKGSDSSLWMYEWLITPKVFRHPLQERIYHATGNLFAQYDFIKWNHRTRAAFHQLSLMERIRMQLRKWFDGKHARRA